MTTCSPCSSLTLRRLRGRGSSYNSRRAWRNPERHLPTIPSEHITDICLLGLEKGAVSEHFVEVSLASEAAPVCATLKRRLWALRMLRGDFGESSIFGTLRAYSCWQLSTFHSCPRQENQFELSKKQSPPIIVPAPDRL